MGKAYTLEEARREVHEGFEDAGLGRRRRQLLTASVIGLFITYAGMVPKELALFGIVLEAHDQQRFLMFFGLLVAYLLLAFIVYNRIHASLPNLVKAINLTIANVETLQSEEEEEEAETTGGIMSLPMGQVIAVWNTSGGVRAWQGALWMILQDFLDSGIPIVIGVLSAYSLMIWQP